MTVTLNITALNGVYVTVADARRSAEWYARCFGMTETDYGSYCGIRLSEGASIVLVESANRNVYESSPFHFKCNDARRAHCDFRTRNATADYAYLLEKGVRLTPLLSSMNRISFSFFDPEGREFGLFEDTYD
jgi:hypothetical protein